MNLNDTQTINPSNFDEAAFKLRGRRLDAVLVPIGKRDEYLANTQLRRHVYTVTDRVLFFLEESP